MHLFIKLAAMATVLSAILWRFGPQLPTIDMGASSGREESLPSGIGSPHGLASLPGRGAVLWPPEVAVTAGKDGAVKEPADAGPAMDVLAATSDDSSRSKDQFVSSISSKPPSFPGHDDNLPLALPDGSYKGALIYIHLDKHVGSLKTNAPNIGAALYSAGVTIGPEDLIAPGLKTPVSQGLHVYIARAKGVTLVVEDVAQKVYSRTENVDSLLREARVAPDPLDIVDPPPARELRNNMVVTVVRVREELVVEEERLEPATEYRSNAELEKGKQKLVQEGSQGHLKRWVRKRLENGREATRVVEREELVQPKNSIIEYGTKVMPVLVETPSGPIQYWRKVTLYATWYTAATSGKARGHPAYGVTRSGLPAGRGVVAVDPTVIPLGTRLYIPGYGPAIAGDTGGGIKGLMVDLGYDENEPHTWRSGWTEVYIVSPEPPASSPRPAGLP